MQGASDWQCQPSGIEFEVLSSMISELVLHHERQELSDDENLDWESPSSRTRVVKYGSSGNLYNVVNQVPDSIATEYQLSYQGTPVFSWHEYRWPHLQNNQQVHARKAIYLPQDCVDELMRYHVDADTSWLSRYRARLRRDRAAQIDEVSVVAEPDRLQVL